LKAALPLFRFADLSISAWATEDPIANAVAQRAMKQKRASRTPIIIAIG